LLGVWVDDRLDGRDCLKRAERLSDGLLCENLLGRYFACHNYFSVFNSLFNILPGSLSAALIFLLCKVSASGIRQVPVTGSLFLHKIPASFRFFFSTGGKGQGQKKKRFSRILLVIPCLYMPSPCQLLKAM